MALEPRVCPVYLNISSATTMDASTGGAGTRGKAAIGALEKSPVIENASKKRQGQNERAYFQHEPKTMDDPSRLYVRALNK